MKTLTVLTAAKYTFDGLRSIVGMNFKYMPELEWKYSYLIALLFIIFTTGVCIYICESKDGQVTYYESRKRNLFLNLISPVFKNMIDIN